MKKIFTLLTLMCFSLFALAQEREITGKVIDAGSGEPLPGVSIVIQGTTLGVTTDLDGNYTVNVSDDQVLIFSSVGYLDETITVSGQTTLDVSLAIDMLSLDEIIVVGYGTQKKSLVTGSIAKVEAEDIAQTRSTRTESALQGKTAGVLVQQQSGAPGASQNIIIRGVGSDNSVRPIYVIDGMRTDGIDWLDPEDIESIEILKDAASTAIYGTEGGNGVIIITTKKGKDGRTVLTYSGMYGVQEVPESFKVMSTPQYLDYYRYASINDGNSTDYADAVNDIPDEDINTNWLDQIYYSAPTQKHKIGVTGGNERSNYYFSMSYTDQEGVVGGGGNSRFTRYATKFNLDSKTTEWLMLGTRLSYSYTEKKGIQENSVFGAVVNNAIVLDPTTPVYYADTNGFATQDYNNMTNAWGTEWYLNPGIQDENGYYGISQKVLNEIQNPVQQLNNDRDKDQIHKLIGGVYGDIEFFEGLNFKTTFDIDLSHQYNRGWEPRTYINRINTPKPRSRANQEMNMYFTWQWESYLSYNQTFGDHTVGAVLGASAREFEHEMLKGWGDDLVKESDNYAWIDNGLYIDTLNNTSEGRLGEWVRSSSIFGRISYSYRDKYMLTSNFRRDGNSKFGPNRKFGFFPSVSVGWVVSREDFWNVSFVNFLKPRYSWGVNGNASSLGWQWEYLTTQVDGKYFYISPSGTLLSVVEPESLVNPDYQWEEVKQHNIGLDAGFLQNRITFAFDWYDKRTEGFLGQGSVPEFVGNQPPTVNLGTIQNTGIEIELGYKETFGDLNMGLQLTAARNVSKVLETNEEGNLVFSGGNIGTFGTSKRFEKGEEPWYFYGYETAGLFNTQAEIDAHVNSDGNPLQPNAVPGDVKYLDISGAPDSLGNATGPDGVIDVHDRTNIGSPYPKWMLGFNVNLEYRGFDFNVFTYASLGNKTLMAASIRDDLQNTNRPDYYLTDAWMSEDQTGSFPRPTANDPNQNLSRINEYLLQNGSFFRINNITLGYTIPTSISERAGISRFRVYLAVDNLYTFTKYKGVDPEVGGDYYGFQGQQWAGIDRGVYPRARTYSAGLNVTF